jgi:hypothetical protein
LIIKNRFLIMAELTISDQIRYPGSGPLDTKHTPVATYTALTTIPRNQRYIGMIVTVISDSNNGGNMSEYQLVGGTADSNWKKKINTSDLTNKRDIVSGNNLLYATNAAGTQISVTYDNQTTTGGNIVQRTTTGDIIVNSTTTGNNAIGAAQVDTKISTAISTKANDADVVKLNGDQSINGVKYFNASPMVPIPTTGNQAANLAYVDEQTDLRVLKAGDIMTGALVLNGDPTIALGAATKQYVDNRITDIESNALIFKGFVSTTQPTVNLKENNLWYNAADFNLTFPWQVYTYTSGAWSTTTTAYTPTAMDLWSKTSDNTGWYYIGQVWKQIDFNGSVFNTTQFTVTNGIVNMANSGITNTQIADNANIQQTKISGLTTTLNTKADNSSVVHVSGDEFISGIKTFNSSPVVPTPTETGQTTNKSYVDTQVATKANDVDVVKLTGNQIVDGIKTFSVLPVSSVAPTGNTQFTNKAYVDTKATDTAVMHLTGDETAAGVKTFSSIPVLPASNPTTDNQAVRKGYVDAQVATKANDVDVIKLTGNQTVTGIKTFNDSPIVPVPTSDNQAANKSYVDSKIGQSGGGTITDVRVNNTTVVSGTIANIILNKETVGLTNVDNTADTNKPISTATQSALDNKQNKLTPGTNINIDQTTNTISATVPSIDSSSFVHVTGNENIGGVKTFTSSPVVPNPTNTGDTTNKNYVDTQVATKANDNNVMHLTGAETAAGVKTFSSIPVLPSNDPTTDNQAVRKAYVDTITDTKANQIDLITHTVNVDNPHSVTKSQVGLEYVDNTADTNKPISTATQTALDNKVDKITTVERVYATDSASTQTSIIYSSGTTSGSLVQRNGQNIAVPATVTGNNAIGATQVDGKISTAVSNYVAKSGDTMTGGLTLNANPTTDLGAATKQYVDQSITNIASNALKFVGFISATAPTTGMREGNYWYSGTTTDTTFPWQVYTYTSGAWSSTTTPYTPNALDGWERLSDTTSWYYFGDHWNQLDFAGSTFNRAQFTTINNVINLRDGSIADTQIAPNANIQQSKISGLTTTLNGKQTATTVSDSGKVLIGGATAGTFGTNLSIDPNPVLGSTNLVTSSGVANELKDSIPFDLRNATTIADGTDWNTLTTVGLYVSSVTVLTTSTNAPTSASAGRLTVRYITGTGYIEQAFENLSGITYKRNYNNGTWSKWRTNYSAVTTEISAATTIPENTDLNTLVAAGNYTAGSAGGFITFINTPTTQPAKLEVIELRGPTYVQQRIYTTNNIIYTRTTNNSGTTWSNWRQVAPSVNVQPGGTLSMTGDEFVAWIRNNAATTFSSSWTVTVTSEPTTLDRLVMANFTCNGMTINTGFKIATELQLAGTAGSFTLNGSASTPIIDTLSVTSHSGRIHLMAEVDVVPTFGTVTIINSDLRMGRKATVSNVTLHNSSSLLMTDESIVTGAVSPSSVGQGGQVILSTNWTGTIGSIDKNLVIVDNRTGNSQDTFIRKEGSALVGLTPFPNYSSTTEVVRNNNVSVPVDTNITTQIVTWTATEDCWVKYIFEFSASTGYSTALVRVDNISVMLLRGGTGDQLLKHDVLPLRKGQVITLFAGSSVATSVTGTISKINTILTASNPNGVMPMPDYNSGVSVASETNYSLVQGTDTTIVTWVATEDCYIRANSTLVTVPNPPTSDALYIRINGTIMERYDVRTTGGHGNWGSLFPVRKGDSVSISRTVNSSGTLASASITKYTIIPTPTSSSWVEATVTPVTGWSPATGLRIFCNQSLRQIAVRADGIMSSVDFENGAQIFTVTWPSGFTPPSENLRPIIRAHFSNPSVKRIPIMLTFRPGNSVVGYLLDSSVPSSGSTGLSGAELYGDTIMYAL